MIARLFLGLALTAGAAVPLLSQESTVQSLLSRYMQRDATVTSDFLSVRDPDTARRELEALAPAFLKADRKSIDNRRRWLVTFALELAQAHSERESVSAGLLVEWACQHVRRHEPIDEFDRRWQLAATALLEGAIHPTALEMHLRHMGGQFPKEPRIALARALVAEQRTAPREVLARGRTAATQPAGASPPLLSLHEEAARRFQELALLWPAVRAEANVRRARTYIWLNRHEDALLALSGVEGNTTDPALRYLTFLLQGLALDGLGRTREAQQAWVSALRVGPGAQSAMMSLATAMFRSGERAAANLMVMKMLEHNDPRADPWWAYWAGDYRLWFALIRDVRELLK